LIKKKLKFDHGDIDSFSKAKPSNGLLILPKDRGYLRAGQDHVEVGRPAYLLPTSKTIV